MRRNSRRDSGQRWSEHWWILQCRPFVHWVSCLCPGWDGSNAEVVLDSVQSSAKDQEYNACSCFDLTRVSGFFRLRNSLLRNYRRFTRNCIQTTAFLRIGNFRYTCCWVSFMQSWINRNQFTANLTHCKCARLVWQLSILKSFQWQVTWYLTKRNAVMLVTLHGNIHERWWLVQSAAQGIRNRYRTRINRNHKAIQRMLLFAQFSCFRPMPVLAAMYSHGENVFLYFILTLSFASLLSDC